MALSSGSSLSHLVTSSPETSGIGMMLAGEIERLDAVARADRPIAMRLQQVVEELHVELVVLHDHDGLGHPPTFRQSQHPNQVPHGTVGCMPCHAKQACHET